MLRAKFCVNKKFANYCLLTEHSFSLRKTCVAGCVFMLSHVISVEWNWTFSSGNCRKSTDLLRVLLTTRMRMTSIPSRWPPSHPDGLGVCRRTSLHPISRKQSLNWWSLNTYQIDMSVVGLQLWWKGTSPEAYIYRSLASLCIYTTSGQCEKSLATSKIHCVCTSTTQLTMREESGYIKGLGFTVYVQITPSQPCVKSLVTSKGYIVYVQWQCGWSCVKRMVTSKGGVFTECLTI